MDPFLYAEESAAAVRARERDEAWFEANPRSTWRVRPILEGESRVVDGLRDRRAGSRGYVIVIDHARAKDRRAAAGRGVYPVFVRVSDRGKAKLLLAREGARWARWFRKSSSTPPAVDGTATLGSDRVGREE